MFVLVVEYEATTPAVFLKETLAAANDSFDRISTMHSYLRMTLYTSEGCNTSMMAELRTLVQSK